MKLRIWKWSHTWEGGNCTSLYSSEAAAIQAIHAYVQAEWGAGVMANEMPTGIDQKDIRKYFEWNKGQEWYSLESESIDFPNLANPPYADEVLMTADECAVTAAALQTVSSAKVAGLANMTIDEAARDLDSAYRKMKD